MDSIDHVHALECGVCWMVQSRVQLYVSLKVSLCALESGSAVEVCARLRSRLGLVAHSFLPSWANGQETTD